MANSIHPTLVKDLANLSKEADQLGITGANLYYCTKYTAPLHVDDDVGRGLCAQLVKNALPQEYAFCHADYGLYMETQSNCLW